MSNFRVWFDLEELKKETNATTAQIELCYDIFKQIKNYPLVAMKQGDSRHVQREQAIRIKNQLEHVFKDWKDIKEELEHIWKNSESISNI